MLPSGTSSLAKTAYYDRVVGVVDCLVSVYIRVVPYHVILDNTSKNFNVDNILSHLD